MPNVRAEYLRENCELTLACELLVVEVFRVQDDRVPRHEVDVLSNLGLNR